MRPLHTLIVVLALAALAGFALYVVKTVNSGPRPERSGIAAPLPMSEARAQGGEAGSEVDALELDPAERARERAPSALAAPAAAAEAVPAAAAPAGGGRLVEGRVVDAAGAPVAEARVLASSAGFLPHVALDALPEVFADECRETRTDADGRFALRGLRPGLARAAVRAPGFAPWDGPTFTLAAAAAAGGSAHSLGTIGLEPGLVLEGRVVDPAGRGVAGAELRRLDEAQGVGSLGQGPVLASTDASGAFRVDELANAPYRIAVQSEQHPRALVAGEGVPSGQKHGLVVELEAGFAIAGRVVGRGEVPASELRVRATPEGARTFVYGGLDPDSESRTAAVASDGTFELEGLRGEREYRLSLLRGAGVELAPFGAGHGRSVSPPKTARAGDRGVELAYQPEGALTFQVVDALTREPLEELSVRAGIRWASPVRGESGEQQTQFPEGRVRAGDLRPRGEDRVRLVVEATGYAAYERDDLRVEPGQEVDLGVIALEPAPVVRVRVTDRATGAPIAGARVALAPRAASSPALAGGVRREVRMTVGSEPHGPVVLGGDARRAETDAEGWAVLTSFEGELCELDVEADDFAPTSGLALELPRARPFEQEVQLGKGGSVVVSVATAEGAPLAGELVRHRRPGAAEFETLSLPGSEVRTDEAGYARFALLEPGVHGFAAGPDAGQGFLFGSGGGTSFQMAVTTTEDSGAADEWSTVDVLEGVESELALVAPLRLVLAGRVLENGQPLPGASVSLEPPLPDGEIAMPRLPRLPGMGSQGPSARTNARGEYEIGDVEEGRYELVIEHGSRHMPERFDVDVRPGSESFDVDLPVTVIEGRVSDGAGGGVAGISIEVEEDSSGPRPRMVMMSFEVDGDGAGETFSISGPEAKAVRTDADGRYVLRGVQSGVELVVKGSGKGFQPGKSSALELAPGEVRRQVDFTMQAGGALTLAATRAGAPAANVMLRLEFADEEPEDVEREIGMTDAAGRAHFDGLVPGRWTIRATSFAPGQGESRDLAAGQAFEAEVAAGEDRTVPLDLD